MRGMDKDRKPNDAVKLATVDGKPATTGEGVPLEPPARRRRTHRRPRPRGWQPTDTERRLVETCIAAGMSIDQVCAIVGKCHQTLMRHCRAEAENGAARCNAMVVGKLFEKCLAGDTIALLFWCKARLGWQERQRVEHSGVGGGPIKTETVEAEANAFTQRILAMAARFETPAPPSNDAKPAPEKPAEVEPEVEPVVVNN